MAVPPHVLIVEDDAGVALLIEMALVADGYTTETLSDGNQALDRLAGPPPDLVVIDVMLPYTDGLNVLRTLRANAAWSSVPVVVVSARGTDGQIAEGRDAGADRYLVKPFHYQDLRGAVRKLLQQNVV